MRRPSTVTLALIALAFLAAMQAVPRLMAICRQKCGDNIGCVAQNLPHQSEPTTHTDGGCCRRADVVTKTPRADCDDGRGQVAETSTHPCSDRTLPGGEGSQRQCRRHPLPCDACIPSQMMAELPLESAAKRPPATNTTEPHSSVPCSGSRTDRLLHSHSPPIQRFAVSGASRCVVIRVLLI